MFRGRILIVSGRPELAAELDPPIRAEGHLSLAVPNGIEALQVLEDGIIPDIVISDGRDDTVWIAHFHRLNQLGRRVEVSTPQTRPTESAASIALAPVPPPFATISLPVESDEIRRVVREAMEGIRRDLESLRGEMFRETARLQRAIRDAQVEMVAALVKIMETKDPFMQGHCERVAGLARRLAEHMGVDEAGVDRLGTAAMLHEIGKVGVSVELLHKTSALSADELEKIRDHAAMGAQIVASVPSLRSLAPLVAHQYTDFRDLGDSIPPGSDDHLLSSILRVVDVYDAMTSSRSYRGTLARDRWEAALRGQSGTRFDPRVVDAFFDVILREAA